MIEELHHKSSFSLLKRVLSYVKPYRKMFVLAFIISVVFAFISPVRAILTQYTVDHFIVNPDLQYLAFMVAVMTGVLIFEALVQFSNEYLAGWLGQTIVRDMRIKLFKHINLLHLKFFDKTPIGTLVTRVVSDMEAIADIFSEGLLVILGDLFKLIVIIGVMFYTNWKLAFISLSVFPMLMVGATIFKNGVNKAFNDVRTQIAQLNTFVQEHLTGMSIVQLFNREETEIKKFKEINAAHRDANIRSIWYYSIFFPFIEILSSVSMGLIVWWGGKGIFTNEFSIGQLVAFIMYINMLFRPIRMIADRFNTLQMGIVASARVFRVMDTENHFELKMENQNHSGKISTTDIKGNLEFRNVWFAYHDENWVLKNISFYVKQGERLALVGATGSGKSSIVALINRLYEYNRGEILIDGRSIREYDITALRRNIGMVLQDVFLYSDTIANNVSLNNSDITREQIIAAAKQVGAHEFIMRLPGNYDYNVMERGSTLSAGQRQLISFIRTYLYNPRILILDEATSSIDAESEMLIQQATETLMKNRTCIVIAHRLTTIHRADKIIVIDKGEIIEQGSHHELLSLNRYYKKLFELQFTKDAVV